MSSDPDKPPSTQQPDVPAQGDATPPQGDTPPPQTQARLTHM